MNKRIILESMEKLPTSAIIIAQVLVEVKADLRKNGCMDIPVFLFHGKYGVGKTTLVKSCMIDEENTVTFAYSDKEIRKQVKGNPNSVMLIDDFAEYNSASARERGRRRIDDWVRFGYGEKECPILIMTAENAIFNNLSESARSRMLEIQVLDVCEDSILSEVRGYFLLNRDELRRFFADFSNWYQEIGKNKYNYMFELERFRKCCDEEKSRTIGLVFAYYICCKMLNTFLKDRYNMEIENRVIEMNVKKLLQAKHTNELTKAGLVKILIERLFNKRAFDVKIVKPKYLCEKYGSGACTYCVKWDSPDERCRRFNERFIYDPMDLLLPDNDTGAILLEKPEYLLQYPNYIDRKHALLIIRSATLLRACNTELESYCYEMGVSLPSYGSKTLNKILFHFNMCLYNYISNDHKIYTFDYQSKSCSNEKIICLKVTEEQVKKLKEAGTVYEGNLNMGDYEEFYLKLKEFGRRVQSVYGEIGNEVNEIA